MVRPQSHCVGDDYLVAGALIAELETEEVLAPTFTFFTFLTFLVLVVVGALSLELDCAKAFPLRSAITKAPDVNFIVFFIITFLSLLP